MPEVVLIATLGAAPQVVTLTLDALMALGEKISRVIVVHTNPVYEPVHTSLGQLHNEFIKMRHYGDDLLYNPHVLVHSEGPLADIATTEELDAAFQSFYTLLRHHKQAGHRVHLSIAGGRKTMALFAMAAAQILFDGTDRLWHLVSDPDLLNSQNLHTEDIARITLVPIPVAHWGHLRLRNQTKAQQFAQTVLTPSEREIVELLVREGLSNTALADRLGKSPKTIANQLTSIYDKLKSYFDLAEPPDRTMLLVLPRK